MKGLIAGIIAGLVGALLWALLAYFSGYEIGWLAWGIGAAVGAAVGWGMPRGQQAGLLAVAISLLAIVGGKYMTVEIMLSQENQVIAEYTETDEYCIAMLARSYILIIEEVDGTVNWPEGVDPDYASYQADFPPDIWDEAVEKWSKMTTEEKESFRAEAQEITGDSMAEFSSDARRAGFLASFSVMDIVFFGLAVMTAYKIASREPEEEAGAESMGDAQEPV